MNFLLGDYFKTDGLGEYKFIENIVKFLNEAIMPITIVLILSAAVFSVIIGAAIVKAESAEKAEEMKKRLWQLFLTVVIVVIGVWLIGWLLSNLAEIIALFRG